ncbi:hypothetical protein D3C80_1628780 [compost metagenome]
MAKNKSDAAQGNSEQDKRQRNMEVNDQNIIISRKSNPKNYDQNDNPNVVGFPNWAHDAVHGLFDELLIFFGRKKLKNSSSEVGASQKHVEKKGKYGKK